MDVFPRFLLFLSVFRKQIKRDLLFSTYLLPVFATKLRGPFGLNFVSQSYITLHYILLSLIGFAVTNFLDGIHRPNFNYKRLFREWNLSPKRRYNLKLGRWIMSKKYVVVIIHHRHIPSEIINSF
jgi:hypothetical protein